MSDIADILASGLHDVDLVPSDVAVGLILLQEEQEQEHAEKRKKGEVRDSRLHIIPPRRVLGTKINKKIT